MRILYVGHKFDYGIPQRGLSFEHYNFFDALLAMGHEILYFDLGPLLKPELRESLNQRLVEIAAAEKPDVMFTVLLRDELDRKRIEQISRSGNTATVNWFCDDHWRFEDYSRLWAPCFNWVVTTARSAIPKYQRIGYGNAIKSQWACNTNLYKKLDLPLQYGMTFIGQPHGNRRAVIEAMRKAGIDVSAWGHGFETGRVSQDRMIEIFQQSRINLNLSNASQSNPTPMQGMRARTISGIGRALNWVPFGRRFKSSVRKKNPPDLRIGTSVTEQIKGRNFEVPGCGGFMMTGRADDLENYFAIGTEIICFDSLADLIDKAKYYLSHETDRAAIADAGYRRTMAEHTYAHRFQEIFRTMGVGSEPNTGRDGSVVYLLEQ